MHFGKTLVATTAASLPFPASAATSDAFSHALARQGASSLPPQSQAQTPALPVVGTDAAKNTHQDPSEGYLFRDNENFAQLARYARHGNEISSKTALKISGDRAIQAEAMQLLKFQADGGRAQYAPATQALRDDTRLFVIENLLEALLGASGFYGYSFTDIFTFIARINNVVEEAGIMTRDMQAMLRIYMKEITRQKTEPLTEKQRQELLHEIAQIEAEHENSRMDDFKVLARNEAENFVISWLSSQIRQRVLNRLPV